MPLFYIENSCLKYKYHPPAIGGTLKILAYDKITHPTDALFL